MKREIPEYIALCDVCSRVKAEHQKPAGLLQPFPYLIGSGTKLEWILLWDYQEQNLVMIRYG
jgi:hypothetical protein